MCRCNRRHDAVTSNTLAAARKKHADAARAAEKARLAAVRKNVAGGSYEKLNEKNESVSAT